MTTPLRAQLRLALVLYGGASLAVYMNGMAQEILALVRAANARALTPDGDGQGPNSPWAEAERLTNPYTDLLTLSGFDVIVDVIAGTSAGGLNGLMLAKALASGAPDLGPLQTLWAEAAQIEKLALADKEVKSLLSGEYLRSKLEGVLRDLEEAGRPEVAALTPILDLFVTATDLHGHLWTKRDRTGKRLEGIAHKWVFRLKRRPGDCQISAPAGDLRQRRNRALSKVGQATSAFPGVFPAVEITQADAEAAHLPLLQGITADKVWFSDGGILANKPFEPVVQQLSQRGALLPVIRVLAYLEPDPSLGQRKEATAPTAIQAALSGVSLPMAQDIQEELGRLAALNEERTRLDGALCALEEAVVRAEYGMPPMAMRSAMRDAAAGALGMHHEIASAVQSAAPEESPAHEQAPARLDTLPPDPITESVAPSLDLAAESVYRSLRLRSLREWLQNLLEEALEQRERTNPALISEVLWSLGLRPGNASDLSLLTQIDLQWGQRRLLFLIDRVNRRYRADTRPKSPAALTEFWRLIWAALDLWLGGRKRVIAALLEVPPASSPAVLAGALRLTLQTIQQEAESLEREALAAARDAFPLYDAADKPVEVLPRLVLDADLLHRLYDGFATADLTLLPLVGYAGSLECEPIRLYRLSPDGSTWGSTPGVEKLAGNAFEHFGAFLDEGWRLNDMLRGRLDAAEQLFRMVALESGLIQSGPDGQPPAEESWPAAIRQALDLRRRQILQAFPTLVSAEAIAATAPRAAREVAAALAPAEALPVSNRKTKPSGPAAAVQEAKRWQTLPSGLIERWVATRLQPQPLPPPQLAGNMLLLLQNIALTLRQSSSSAFGDALQRTLLVILTPFVWIARLLLMPGVGLAQTIQSNLGPIFTAGGLALIAGDMLQFLKLSVGGWWLAAALLSPVLIDALFNRSPYWLAFFALLTGATGAA
ncbi:MAG TPA: patatin-like protein, partial [Symbiobacteriaceae bacterium]|nr:patatin-like protein [Symbiobacteriaceae bacterium]